MEGRKMRTAWHFVLVFAFVLVLQSYCRADYIAALHWPSDRCFPCRQMVDVENLLRAEGRDIRTIDILAHPEWASAPGRGVPRYVYVREVGGKSYYTGQHIDGLQTVEQLRRFCVIPTAAAVGAWTRNVWRALWEW